MDHAFPEDNLIWSLAWSFDPFFGLLSAGLTLCVSWRCLIDFQSFPVLTRHALASDCVFARRWSFMSFLVWFEILLSKARSPEGRCKFYALWRPANSSPSSRFFFGSEMSLPRTSYVQSWTSWEHRHAFFHLVPTKSIQVFFKKILLSEASLLRKQQRNRSRGIESLQILWRWCSQIDWHRQILIAWMRIVSLSKTVACFSTICVHVSGCRLLFCPPYSFVRLCPAFVPPVFWFKAGACFLPSCAGQPLFVQENTVNKDSRNAHWHSLSSNTWIEQRTQDLALSKFPLRNLYFPRCCHWEICKIFSLSLDTSDWGIQVDSHFLQVRCYWDSKFLRHHARPLHLGQNSAANDGTGECPHGRNSSGVP